MSEEKKGSLELNWINKDKSLLYEYDEDGEPVRPKKWVGKDDLRVAEPRPLKFKSKFGNKDDSVEDNSFNSNMLIQGDNLLALKSLAEMFRDKSDDEKVKCIYIDPPFNIGKAFEDYDDNLEHSEWLTMMRDRLLLLRKLLSRDGAIFIHIDKTEVDYLKVVCDEVFGRDNFINKITVETRAPSGFKLVNPGVFSTAEYLLLYAKDKEKWEYIPQYVENDYDQNYNKFIPNKRLAKPSDWNIVYLRDYVAKDVLDFSSQREAREKLGKTGFNYKIGEFARKNADRVFRHAAISESGAGKDTVDVMKKSEDNPDNIYVVERENYDDRYIHNGDEIVFYTNKVKKINGKKVPTKPLTDVWTDIAWEGIANEGHVKLKKGKKPEKLIKRVIQMSTREGDLVLDSFLGSGTTAAVAHKMDRRWIGIEILEHQMKKCLKRLKKVIDSNNTDDTGISKDDDVKWQGRGYFKYFKIGDSILSGDKEMDWSHSTEDLAKSVFWMFDYSFKELLEFQYDFDLYLGQKKEKFAFSIISEDAGIIRKEELDNILDLFKEKYGPNKEIEIYTNYGVGVDEKDLPNNLTIRKVPDCILEKYKLGEE